MAQSACNSWRRRRGEVRHQRDDQRSLTFASAPNYEAPTDVGSDNTYEVIVRASDGTATDDQTLTVTVTGMINEGAVPPVRPPVTTRPLIDGVSVRALLETSADG